MRYSGLQPQYFPRLHYFARMMDTDVFVIRDEVQYVRKHKYPDGKNGPSYQATTPIKQAHGLFLLNLPIQHDGKAAIKDTKLSYTADSWQANHLKTFQMSYSRAPFYASIMSELEPLINKQYESLADLNTATLYWGLLRILGKENITLDMLTTEYVQTCIADQKEFRIKKIVKSSDLLSKLPVKDVTTLSPNEKIVQFMKILGTNEEYCGGTAKAAYLDEKFFAEHGIKIVVQDWTCQQYVQQFEKQQGFIPNLSIIDLLMNVPTNEAQRVISGQE